jgi:hypothetical protein
MIAGTLSEVLNGKSCDRTAANDGDEANEGAFLRLRHMPISELILSSSSAIALARAISGIRPG